MGQAGFDSWALERALLDFQAAPGRFTRGSPQRARIERAVDEVIRIANERSAAHEPVRAAARFFIVRGVLNAEDGPFATLGLPRDASPGDIKKRYRMLMRLLHPDFSGAASVWPADAAVRINLAYEELTAPRPRAASSAGSPPVAPVRATGSMRRRSPRSSVGPRREPVRWAIIGSFGAAMLLMAALLVTTPEPQDQLVERPMEKPRTVQRALASVIESAQSFSSSVAALAGAVPRPAPPPGAPAAAKPAKPAPDVVQLSAPQPPREMPPSQPLPVEPFETPVVIATSASAPPAASTTPPVVARAAVPAPQMPAAAPATPPAPAPAIVESAPAPSLKVSDVHPLLTVWLQQLESGNSARMLSQLDPEARRSEGAVRLAQQYAELTRSGPLHVTGAEFAGEPRPGGVIVRGTVKLRAADPDSPPRDFKVEVEFVQRGNLLSMTRLAPAVR